MKNIKYFLGALLMAGTMVACSPDEFPGMNEAGVPEISQYTSAVKVDVNQETNEVTFSLDAPGVYPVWVITEGDKEYRSSLNGYSRKFLVAGTYAYKCYVASRDGVSTSYTEGTFTLNTSRIDISKEKGFLTAKPWRIASSKPGHLGCGENLGNPTGWWSAAPNEKADWGVYDCVVTFAEDGNYTLNPGESGVIYVNKDVTVNGWDANYTGDGNDYNVPVDGDQNSKWTIEIDGTDLWINLGTNPYFPYVAHDQQWTTPRLKIVSISAKSMTLVTANYPNGEGTIAWQYILTTEEETSEDPNKESMDWDATSAANLWKSVESEDAFISVTPWFADNDWGQISDPEWKHEGDIWSLTIPEGMGGSQWQGQFPINTSLTASMDKKYNFYCVVEADNDCKGVTIKFTETDEAEKKHDDNFFFADQHNIEANEPFIFKAENVQLPKNDAHAMSLFFDFGGSPVGTNVKISKIYFEEAVTVDYNDANNLWKGVDDGSRFVSISPWFADNDWGQISDPEWKHEGDIWSLTIPEGMGGSQWMGQFPINTDLTASMDDTYNFSCTIEATEDCPGVTIKLTETDDAEKHDNNFFFADRHDVTGGEPFIYTVKNVKLPLNDAHALSLFFDFGGSPIGTTVKISNIVLIKN